MSTSGGHMKESASDKRSRSLLKASSAATEAIKWLVLTLSVAVFVFGVTMLVQRFRAPVGEVDPGKEVIATVDGEPVYGVDLGPHVRPQRPWVGVTPPDDPVDSALRDAVMIRLIVAEARRQGLQPTRGSKRSVADGQLVQALIDSEVERMGLGPESISAAQCRAFFESHRDELSQFRGAIVSAIVVTDLQFAKKLLAEGATATTEEFQALVAQHSVDATSKAKGGVVAEVDATAENIPLEVAKVVVSTKRDGDVGLADTKDGRYWVIRVTSVRLEEPQWNAAMEHRIRQLLIAEQRGEVMRQLEARLRPEATISINEEALDRYRAEVTNDLLASSE